MTFIYSTIIGLTHERLKLSEFRKTRKHVNQGKNRMLRALFVISKATFTKTTITPKFTNTFSLKNFSATIIDQCSIFI